MTRLMLTSDTHYGIDGKTHNKHMKFWKRVAATIKRDNIKALIWAGDIASHKQRHLRRSIEMAREFVDIPILLVRGNHDLWDGKDKKDKQSGLRSLDSIYEEHKQLFKDNDVYHLEQGFYVIDDVFICGFDGWYGNANPPTNDKHWMPKHVNGEAIVNPYLSSRAWKEFQRCLDYETFPFRKKIIVTHQNPYPYGGGLIRTCLDMGISYTGHDANFKFLQEMKGNFDILCCGHSHRLRHDDDEKIMIYNCGSDYNLPKFLAFEA